MENSRKQFLKQLFISATAVPVLIEACKKSDAADPGTDSSSGACTVSPEETDGPYPLYNSRGSSIQRVDITDGKTGTPLQITINILNTNNSCKPLANARVDIWHCDKDGYYSGYSNRDTSVRRIIPRWFSAGDCSIRIQPGRLNLLPFTRAGMKAG
ncbi:protocatechuate 3,4-dioxygenase beta subunit [Chitinophaga sp. W3I9]|uniref:hypothetical protein n=1 Tax=Chitinophaga sp. W3I9 TaxID=3373924 RepID=UPI003D1A77E1